MLELSPRAKCLGLGTGRTHRTLRVRPVPYLERVAKLFLTGRDLSETSDNRRSVRCEEVLQVQLAVAVAPDTLQSASGATSSVSGALILFGIRVAGPWT